MKLSRECPAGWAERAPFAISAPPSPSISCSALSSRRSWSLKLSDTRVCEPQIRARLGNHNTSILCCYRKLPLTLELCGILPHTTESRVPGRLGRTRALRHLRASSACLCFYIYVFSIESSLLPKRGCAAAHSTHDWITVCIHHGYDRALEPLA
jgi:hypothetical protein